MTPSDTSQPAGRALTTWLVFAAYLAIAIGLTWPLTPQLATGVPNDLGDPLLNVWILWWNAVTVPFTDAWWNAPAYFPAAGVLTFSEHLLGLSPISSPIYWATGNAQLGYNVVILLSFPLSAIFAYLLCRDLTGRRDAAFIGGLVFGFTPYRIVQLPHIQVLCSYWMPVTLLGLHRYLRDRRARWLVVFAGGWLMQALSNGYYMVFLSVLVAVWLLWFLPWREWRTVLAVGAAWAIAAIPVVPIVLRYQSVHHSLGLKRSVDEMLIYSADITALLDHSTRLVFWQFLSAYHRPEGELFPGLAGVLLVVLGLWISRSRRQVGAPARRSRLRVVLTVLLLVLCGLVTLAAVAPYEGTIAGITFSITHFHKPLSLAFITAVALFFTSPRVRRSVRGRTALGFYVLGAVLMWMFSFGPKPTFMGVQAFFQGPYSWLTYLPGLDTLRTPARFHMVAVLCLSCAAAICFARLTARMSRTSRVVFTTAAIVIALGDTWIVGFPMEAAPKPWRVQASEARSPVVEVPLGGLWNDVEAMYRSMWTGVPLVNGYSGFEPPWYGAMMRGLASQDATVLRELSTLGVRQLVINTTMDGSAQWLAYVGAHPDITLVADDGEHRLYRLPESAAITDRPLGAAVRIAHVTANFFPDLVPLMLDGDFTTRWHTEAQRGTERVEIDFGAPVAVRAIVLSLGRFSRDAPQDLAIDVSDDSQTWNEVFRGTGAGQAFRAGVRDPLHVPTSFDIGDRTTRFVRLRQTGMDRIFYWSIAELGAFAPPSGS